MVKRPGIPSIDQSIDQKIRTPLMLIKENIEIANGVRTEWLRRSVTLGMLVKAGIITEEQARLLFQEP